MGRSRRPRRPRPRRPVVGEAIRAVPHLTGLWWHRSRWFALPALLCAALGLRALMIALGYAGMLVVIAAARLAQPDPHAIAARSVLVLTISAATTGVLAVRVARRAPLVLIAMLGIATEWQRVLAGARRGRPKLPGAAIAIRRHRLGGRPHAPARPRTSDERSWNRALAVRRSRSR